MVLLLDLWHVWVLLPRSQTTGEGLGLGQHIASLVAGVVFQNFNACYNIAKINLSHMTNQMCVLKTITVLYGKFIWTVQRWWFCVRGGC